MTIIYSWFNYLLLKSRPNCLVFLTNDTVVVGGESPRAEVHSLIEKKVLAGWACHDTRVRCMTSINTHTDAGISRYGASLPFINSKMMTH